MSDGDAGADAATQGHEAGGSHTDGGLTVADLIAKVGAPVAGRPRHHHAAPDLEPADPESQLPIDEQDNGYRAYAPSAASEYAYDLPDLDAARLEPLIDEADVE